MSSFQMLPHPRPNILDVYSERTSINLSPAYQRISGVWDLRKRRLLIDSIVNGVDLPKIYFHELNPSVGAQGYAVVDGKQRLESMFDFLDGNLLLPDEFTLFEDPSINACGLDYDGLARRHPRLRARFDQTKLPIIIVRTDDINLIEQLFSRLNEAVPLTAPEYRNTLGGPLPRLFRQVSAHPFFLESLPFETGRHRHLDLAAKFVYLIHGGGFQSTKKNTLDRFVRNFRHPPSLAENPATPYELTYELAELVESVEGLLDEMHRLFESKDPLLTGIGRVTLFFHVFRLGGHLTSNFSRQTLSTFVDDMVAVRNRTRQISKGLDQGGLTQRQQQLAHFDSLRQSPNDGTALRTRYELMRQDIAEQHGIDLPTSD